MNTYTYVCVCVYVKSSLDLYCLGSNPGSAAYYSELQLSLRPKPSLLPVLRQPQRRMVSRS